LTINSASWHRRGEKHEDISRTILSKSHQSRAKRVQLYSSDAVQCTLHVSDRIVQNFSPTSSKFTRVTRINAAIKENRNSDAPWQELCLLDSSGVFPKKRVVWSCATHWYLSFPNACNPMTGSGQEYPRPFKNTWTRTRACNNVKRWNTFDILIIT